MKLVLEISPYEIEKLWAQYRAEKRRAEPEQQNESDGGGDIPF